MKSCDVKKSTVESLKNNDNLQDEIFFRDVELSQQDREMLKGISGFFLKKLTGRRVISDKSLQRKINQDYKGKEAERNYLLTKLAAILDANPGIRKMIQEEAALAMLKTERKTLISKGVENRKAEIARLPKLKDSYNAKETKIIKDFADKNKIQYKPYEPAKSILQKIQLQYAGVSYSDLSIGSLRLLLGKAQDIVQNGNGNKLGRGVIGKLRVELLTARGLGKYDYTGAIANMAEGVINYTQNITRHINRFTEKNQFGDTSFDKLSKKRNYGIDKIYENVQALGDRVLDLELREALDFNDEYVIDFFQRILAGWVKWDGTQYKIASTYDVSLDDDGNVRRYESTGDPIYEYQNFVTFDEYVKMRSSVKKLPRNEQKKTERYHRSFNVDNNYVKMVKQLTKQNKQLAKYEEQARGIHSEVFKYASKMFEQAHNQLMIELKQYFPNLNNEQIETLLKSADATQEDAFKLLTEKEQDDLTYIIDAFGSYSLLDPYIFGSQEFAERKGTFPILYEQDYFKTVMWEEALNEAKENMKKAANELVASRNLYMSDKSNLEYKNVYNKSMDTYKSLSAEVARMELIRNRLDNYPTDHYGNTMPLARDVSVLKTITNSFDVRNQRADKLVYGEYLNRLFSGLERNRLSIRLLKSLRDAESIAAKDSIVSQYKGINNDPSARSSFMGVPTDLETVQVFLNKIPLVGVTTEVLSAKIRAFNSWITGMHLRGTSSAILNSTAIQEGFFHLGLTNMAKALVTMTKQKEAVQNLVKISGIVDFSDFIQRGLVQKAVDMDLTIHQANEITTAVMVYWKDVNSGKNKNKALRKLREKLIVSIENVPSEERTKRRISQRKSDKRRRMVNVFANWAIEKQYDVKKTIKNVPYRALGSVISNWGNFLKRHRLTMGETEKTLRTWQFIAAINSAMESKLIPNVPLDELKGENLEAAINIGRLYVQISAFSVGRENIGEISRGEVGGFLTKFKYYAIQKFGADVDKFKDAYYEMQDYADKGRLKTIASLLKELFNLRNAPQKVLRTTRPSVASLRNFIAIQGILTPFVDLFIFGPFAVARHLPGVRHAVYMTPGMKTIGGMTSDLISLSMIIPNILIAMSLGDWGEDEEEVKDTFEYYMRRTPAGYGWTLTYDTFMALMSLLSDADAEEKAKDIKNALSPVLPREVTRTPYVGEFIDEKLEEIIE